VDEPTQFSGASRIRVRGGTLATEDGKASLAIGLEAQILGRSPHCDLVLAGDKKISAVHAEVIATPHGALIRDRGSKNGTYVGNLRIEAAYLTHATRLRVGATHLQFVPAEAATQELPKAESFGALSGSSLIMRRLFAQLARVAPSSLTVLITGETGTGKELCARAIHDASGRAKGKFVAINCAGVPEALIESELFGHVKGAFSGAAHNHPGLFVEADGGTLFPDELGEMSPLMQAKLLRAVELGEIRPVGGTSAKRVDVRLVAATCRELAAEINAGRFRADLYFRVAQAKIEMPPLRDRLEDIRVLVRHMLADGGASNAFERITPDSFDRLARHAWIGNVRELRNVVRMAVALDDGGPLELYPQSLDGAQVTGQATGPMKYRDHRDASDRAYFAELIRATQGNLSEFARVAGLDRKTAREALRRHGLVPKR
jgi:DNA-binding NtrC family response regulator